MELLFWLSGEWSQTFADNFPFKDVVKNLFNPLDFQSDPQFVLQRRTWHHFHLKQLPFRDAQEKTKSIPWRWYQKPLISFYFQWIPQYPHRCPRGSPLFSTFFLDGPLSWHQWYQMKVGFVRFGVKRNPKIIDYNCHDKNIKKSKQFETLSEEILADAQDLPLHVFLLPTKGPNKRSWQGSPQTSKATWGPGSKSSSLRYGLRHRSRAARFQSVSLKVPGSLSIYSLQLT